MDEVYRSSNEEIARCLTRCLGLAEKRGWEIQTGFPKTSDVVGEWRLPSKGSLQIRIYLLEHGETHPMQEFGIALVETSTVMERNDRDPTVLFVNYGLALPKDKPANMASPQPAPATEDEDELPPKEGWYIGLGEYNEVVANSLHSLGPVFKDWIHKNDQNGSRKRWRFRNNNPNMKPNNFMSALFSDEADERTTSMDPHSLDPHHHTPWRLIETLFDNFVGQ